ncbi:MAG TPA: hypothetical protein PK784_06665 [Tenuifilaceae bacterium]|nr:hypothetical protein [Tenuifilaceae bacterium]HPN23094.1 hypothetical protein [Tenuifilaceae bacterium]
MQDVRRVIVTSKYEIRDGKRTGISMAIKQEIKDSLDRVHTIINRDYVTQSITSHTWHTFKGKQIVRTDEFANERLKYYKLFTYTSDTLIDTETIYMVSPDDTAVYVKLQYKYKNGKPVQVNAVDSKGKTAYSLKSVFDGNGTEISRKVKVKKAFAPLDSIIERTISPLYDSAGRVLSETIKIKFVDGKAQIQKFNYGYNKLGLLTSIEELDEKGSLMYKKTLEYNDKGILKFVSVYNANNELTGYYAKRYELYPTRDRRNQIIEY